jgi:hypothetical protein
MAKLSTEKLRALRDTLELKLRRRRGNAFQDFFSEFMLTVHGDEFVPAIASGRAGDLKCDGRLNVPLTIFACYGPTGGGAYLDASVATAAAKVASDYKGAVKEWPKMKQWTFVSNFVEGVPPQITSALDAVKAKIPVGYFGRETFEKHLRDMDESAVELLLGPITTIKDYANLHPKVVREVVDRIAAEFKTDYAEGIPRPVPPGKIELNQIPPCHAAEMKRSFAGLAQIQKWVLDSADPTLEGRLSAAFRAKYLELRLQPQAKSWTRCTISPWPAIQPRPSVERPLGL